MNESTTLSVNLRKVNSEWFSEHSGITVTRGKLNENNTDSVVLDHGVFIRLL